MLTVNRLVCRGTRSVLPVYTSNAACAFASKAGGDWLQKDKLKEKLNSILAEHKTRQQRLDYAEKVMFPNEPDPTKPSKAAVEAAVKANMHIPQASAVAIPNWREAVAKQEREWAEQERQDLAESQAKDRNSHH